MVHRHHMENILKLMSNLSLLCSSGVSIKPQIPIPTTLMVEQIVILLGLMKAISQSEELSSLLEYQYYFLLLFSLLNTRETGTKTCVDICISMEIQIDVVYKQIFFPNRYAYHLRKHKQCFISSCKTQYLCNVKYIITPPARISPAPSPAR